MEYLLLKKLEHVNGFSRIIPKHGEPFEETVILALRAEGEIKNNVECCVSVTGGYKAECTKRQVYKRTLSSTKNKKGFGT